MPKVMVVKELILSVDISFSLILKFLNFSIRVYLWLIYSVSFFSEFILSSAKGFSSASFVRKTVSVFLTTLVHFSSL
jgi:hypothetical protein